MVRSRCVERGSVGGSAERAGRIINNSTRSANTPVTVYVVMKIRIRLNYFIISITGARRQAIFLTSDVHFASAAKSIEDSFGRLLSDIRTS